MEKKITTDIVLRTSIDNYDRLAYFLIKHYARA